MVIALVLILPTFFFGQISGNDFHFHIASWMEVAHQWHEGAIYPSWAAGAFQGFGEPRFIFYPPLSWLLGASLGLILPWKTVPDVYLFIVLVFSGISMHRFARRWLPQRGAIAAAVIYVASPYHLVDVYARSSYSELLASAILPLAVLCVLNCAGGEQIEPEQSGRERWRNSALLSIAYAAIWFTNAPMAVVTSYALAFLLVIVAFRRRSFTTFVTGAAALALGLVLAAAYIVPAAFEQRWVNISQAISTILIFRDNILFTCIRNTTNGRVNLLVSVVGTFEIAAAFAAAAALRRRTRKANTAYVAMAGLAALSAAMMLPGTASVLQYLPKMRFIQFPWRWLIPLGISFAFFFGAVLPTARRRLAIGLLYLALLAATRTVLCSYYTWWDSVEVRQTLAAIQTGVGYGGTREYGPPAGDTLDLPPSAIQVSLLPDGTLRIAEAEKQSALRPAEGVVSIETWLTEHKVFTVTAPQPVAAAVHLLNYPAWRVRVNDQLVTPGSDPDTGQMLIPLPSGTSHVEVRFGWTWDRKAGAALSAAGILMLSCIVFIGWRRPADRVA